MGDDFSALELDTELDDDMRALFGDSQESAGPSMPGRQALPLPIHSRFPQTAGPSRRQSQSQAGRQSLMCVTNKRPATELNQSWPHKSRQPSQTMPLAQDDLGYDDLELEVSAPATCAVSCITNSSSNTDHRRHNSILMAPNQRYTVPAFPKNPLNTASDPASQVTERWHSANSQRSLQASQASASIQSISARQQLCQAPSFTGATSAARPAMPGHANTDISSAMVSHLPSTASLEVTRGRTNILVWLGPHQIAGLSKFADLTMHLCVPLQSLSDSLLQRDYFCLDQSGVTV